MSQSPKRIFVVEDQPDFRLLIQDFLTLQGYEVRAFDSAAAALTHLSQCKEGPQMDLIISDYNMPGMDGLQLFHELKKMMSPVPFILLSALAREAPKNLGIHAYIAKPVSLGTLAETIRHALTK